MAKPAHIQEARPARKPALDSGDKQELEAEKHVIFTRPNGIARIKIFVFSIKSR